MTGKRFKKNEHYFFNTEAKWRNANDTRTITLSLNFRFGKAISDLRRHNAIGAQSEQNRVKD